MANNIVYGKNSFNEALNSNRIIKALISNEDYIEILKKKRIPFEVVNRKKLDSLSSSNNHQGVLAYVKEFEFSSVESMLKKENGFIVILDGIQDVHNLGAIIRTCECAGVDGIIYKSHDSAKINDTVAKVASGALEYMKIAEVDNLTNTIKKLKKEGYWVVGSDGSADKLYTDIDYNMNVVLIIGSEGKGISRLVKENCDFMVKLPMEGKVTSLNASVAAGILIYNVISSRN